MDMPHAAIAAQDRHPFRVDHPGNFSVRVRFEDQPDRRQGMHHVPERTRLDDKDPGACRFQTFD
jgi:hypothetical protein